MISGVALTELGIVYVFLFLLGASFGSFYNVCISRIPRKISLVTRASHCPVCGTAIKPWHNIPIFSYLMLGGKCNSCKTRINPHYFWVELITALLFMGLFYRFGERFDLLYFKYLILFSVGLIVFVIDLQHYIIPDSLSLPLIPLGIAAAFSAANDISLQSSILAAVLGFVLFLVVGWSFEKLTGKEGLGGGDIKLIAGIGAFTGMGGLFFTVLFSSLSAVILMLLSGHERQKVFPYGPFIIVASFIYAVFGDVIISRYLGLFGL
jgi:leader peptidase (prepilin peptidase)/N-methyltransferase